MSSLEVGFSPDNEARLQDTEEKMGSTRRESYSYTMPKTIFSPRKRVTITKTTRR